MKFLYENQKIEQEDLIKSINTNKSLHPYFESNFKDVRPKNYCGFLSVDKQNYFILPKITSDEIQNLNSFIYMLIYAYDIKLSNETLLSAKNQEHSIFEVFIRLFADELLRELKKGVFKQYINMQENLKVLRGKYIIEKNFNNFYHQNIFCEYDEFSMDNKLNHFFIYALRIFKKYSSYQNLYRCESILDEVSHFNIDFKRLNIYFDRMNSRYRKSYKVALMLLQKFIPMVEKGKDESFAFLFDMAEVFEKFVGKLYREIDSSSVLQKQGSFGNLVLKPDIYTSSLIVDTKYKKINDIGDLSIQDKYQMFVYGVNFDVKNTMLLYPKHLVDIDEYLKLGKDEKTINLRLKCLDLAFGGGYDDFVCETRERLEIINGI